MAEDATWLPGEAGEAEITVHFFADFKLGDALGEKYETSYPHVLCKSSDVTGAAKGDELEVRSTTYKVIGVHNSGQGMTTLVLSTEAAHG